MAKQPSWTGAFFDEEYARVWSFPGAEATATEIAFLVDILPPPPARVLDLGCGNGRHAIGLASRGYEVTGIDAAAAFLELARAAATSAGVAVDWVQADMRQLDLEGFDAALVLGNTFGYEADEDNRRALTRFAAAVKPGGQVIIELLNRDRIVANYRPLAEHIAGDGTRVRVESTFDPLTGINTVVHTWSGADGQPRRRASRQRLYAPTELASLCQIARLQPVAWYDGLTPEGFHLQARRLVLVAERTAGQATRPGT